MDQEAGAELGVSEVRDSNVAFALWRAVFLKNSQNWEPPDSREVNFLLLSLDHPKRRPGRNPAPPEKPWNDSIPL